MRRLLPILVIILAASCSTFTLSEGPEWIRMRPVRSGVVVFVGSGTGGNEAEARSAAYLDLLKQMSMDLGYEVTGLYYRELLSTDGIEELGTRITDRYSAPGDGRIHYFALAETPEERYYSSRSQEYAEALERTGTIAGYLDSALEAYRNNRDTESLAYILEALDESLSGPVTDPGHTPGNLLGRAMEILGNIELSLRDPGPGTEVTVRMERAKGFFHPPVVSGMIRASYTMVDGEGNETGASVSAMTGDNGRVRFVKVNPYTVRRGSIGFSVDVPEDLLASIAAKAGEGFIEDFMSLLDEKTVRFDYADSGRLDSSSTIISVTSYDQDGMMMPGSEAAAAFSAFLSSVYAQPFTIVQGIGDDEGEVLSYLRREYPGMEDYVILRIGIVDSAEGGGVSYARSESRLSAYSGQSALPYIQQDSYAAGRGESEEEAGYDSLRRGAEIAAGMFLSHL